VATLIQSPQSPNQEMMLSEKKSKSQSTEPIPMTNSRPRDPMERMDDQIRGFMKRGSLSWLKARR